MQDKPSFSFDRACPLDALRRRLVALAEPEYRDFVSKFLPGVGKILGVRVPAQRLLAREIARSCGAEFLDAVLGLRLVRPQSASDSSLDSNFDERPLSDATSRHSDGDGDAASTFKNQEKTLDEQPRKFLDFESYEERLTVGLVVAETRLDFDAFLDAVAAFLPTLASWGDCDVFSASLRLPKDRRVEFWEFLDCYVESPRPFETRFAVVATLNHFLETNYLDAVFERVERVAARRLGEYYVDMSLAWLVAEAFVRFPDATYKFLRQNKLDDFSFNKALQKIVESRRVDAETKEEIRRLKRPRRVRRSSD